MISEAVKFFDLIIISKNGVITWRKVSFIFKRNRLNILFPDTKLIKSEILIIYTIVTN